MADLEVREHFLLFDIKMNVEFKDSQRPIHEDKLKDCVVVSKMKAEFKDRCGQRTLWCHSWCKSIIRWSLLRSFL